MWPNEQIFTGRCKKCIFLNAIFGSHLPNDFHCCYELGHIYFKSGQPLQIGEDLLQMVHNTGNYTKGVFTSDPKWNLPKTKFQFTIKEILFTLVFIAGEIKRISFWRWPEINGPLSKNQSFLFTHVQIFRSLRFHFE